MDKRLAKRHKRHVARAKQHLKVSEPDVRTPEQIKAAREASRPDLRPGGLNAWPTFQERSESDSPKSDEAPKPENEE
jgi:hypothetical protein